MWIETCLVRLLSAADANSFASKGECGLKHEQANGSGANSKNSFASNGECGLKLAAADQPAALVGNSFASNGECGLKQEQQCALGDRVG